MTYRLFEGKDHAASYWKYRISPSDDLLQQVLGFLEKHVSEGWTGERFTAAPQWISCFLRTLGPWSWLWMWAAAPVRALCCWPNTSPLWWEQTWVRPSWKWLCSTIQSLTSHTGGSQPKNTSTETDKTLMRRVDKENNVACCQQKCQILSFIARF